MEGRVALILCTGLLGLGLLFGETGLDAEKIDSEVNWKIRREGSENSQIMRTLHFLTDIHGPRLTGSPNLKAAGEWAVGQMEDWGMENGGLEPWDWGHPGWQNERLSVHVLSPVKDHLTCEVVAWTPGTGGPVSGQVVLIELPEEPTEAQLANYLDGIRDQVKGKVVFVGAHRELEVTFNPASKRREDAEVRSQFDPENPAPVRRRPQRPRPSEAKEGQPKPLGRREVAKALDKFLLQAGALVKVTDAARRHGQIRAFANRTYEPDQVGPAVVMRNEDYGRISRILADGTPVELEFDIVNRVYPEGKTAYNAVAEIPGTDKRDEVVMLGAHLDSWHSATGATDNATGSAIMMEAARILKAIGVRPRRTVRVALWSGEEQGLLGSKAYVKEHFGSFEEPKPGYWKFAGYFNIDSGTGRARGASVFGPAGAAAVLRDALKPFEDLGVLGARASNSRRSGGTDSTSFNAAGLPGIGMLQDPIEYGSHTWHTNLDNYEHVVEEDLKKSAIVIAAAVYHLAMRDEMLPRFSAEEMPKPVQPPGSQR